MKCFDCEEDLNSIEEAFITNFEDYKKGIKIALCSDCSYKRTLIKIDKEIIDKNLSL